MEKVIAHCSSTLAWKIPWAEEPGRLQSMGSRKVEHDWATSISLLLFTFMHWINKWQPTPVFLPGESQGRGSLVGCCLRVLTELNTLKQLSSSSKYDTAHLFLIHSFYNMKKAFFLNVCSLWWQMVLTLVKCFFSMCWEDMLS